MGSNKSNLYTTVLIVLSFITGIAFNQQLLKDKKQTILDIVINYPEIFQMSSERKQRIIEKSELCKTLKEGNFKNYNFGNTLSLAKKQCLDQSIEEITKAMAYSQNMDSLKGHIVLYIGNPSNSFNAEYIGINSLTQQQSYTYLNNVQMIMKAIPKNIPTMEVLTKFTIDNVQFFDNYAKVEFIEDVLIQKLQKEETPYKGQF